MGTRNLTMVVKGGRFKVAQYGQWDGYPEGQGATVLKFLTSPNFDLDLFRQRVEQCHFGTDEEIKAAYAGFTTGDGWMTMEQADAFKASKYGYLSRDTGADILNLINATPIGGESDGLMLKDEHRFAKDSLFCEWAYLIDLDANQPRLEVYVGFNKTPLTETNRFYDLSPTAEEIAAEKDDVYYPIRLLKSYPLDELPSEEEFVAELNALAHPEDEEAETEEEVK